MDSPECNYRVIPLYSVYTVQSTLYFVQALAERHGVGSNGPNFTACPLWTRICSSSICAYPRFQNPEPRNGTYQALTRPVKHHQVVSISWRKRAISGFGARCSSGKFPLRVASRSDSH